ncbi:MAG TPA: type 2 lanthipeptide synthetase LanM family protein [Candidatus Angelobacter sp.]
MSQHSHAMISIVERSAFLYERITSAFVSKQKSKNDAEAGKGRILQWRQQVARGDDNYFKRRLAWDGLDGNRAEEISAGVQIRDPNYLPTWVEYLEGGLAGCAKLGQHSLEEIEHSNLFLNSSNAAPFAHVFTSFIEYASGRLKNLSGPGWSFVSQAVQVQLQQQLQATLSEVAQRVLYIEFLAWRILPGSGVIDRAEDGDRRSYSGFVHHMWNAGLARLCEEYPVLARFLGRTAEMWVLSLAEFIGHVTQDIRELEIIFNSGRPLGAVVEICNGFSDKHNSGKSVLKVKFDSGISCFYKPKDCKSERQYNDLLTWLNEHGSPLPFKTYKILDRADHGWTEEMVALPCKTIDEVERYYERGGMLLALLFVLQASDCNYDNIICQGEHPVVVDTETLLQPKPREFQTHPWKALEAANQAIYYDSVFRLCLLPRWIARPNGEKLDVSGFGAGSMRRGYFKRKVWRDTNTDRMIIAWERVPVARDLLGVRLGAETVNPTDYVDVIIRGFECMYRMLMDKSDELWTHNGPLSKMTEISSRFIPRNTTTYMGILDQCLQPDKLRDGMDTSIWVDSLARAYFFLPNKPAIWPMIAAEHAAILDLNIPRFLAPTQTDALQIGPLEYVPGYFVEASMVLLRKRFSSLSEQDLDLQKRYIRCAFEYVAPSKCTVPVRSDTFRQAPAVDVQAFLDNAVDIAEKIRNKAIHGADGTANWISQAYNADSQFWQLQPMGVYLYDGVCGIALFLAAVEHVTGRSDFRHLINAVNKIFSHDSLRVVQRLAYNGIGAASGTASIVYSLARMALLLGDDEILNTALTTARLITRERIAADRRLDVMGGSAGCLLVLAFLYGFKPDGWILDRAIDCADHLLETRLPSPSKPRSWKTIQDQFLAGFSHGAAGIILALVKAFELSGNKAYLEAAAEAQEYEDSIYSEEKQNWPNLLLPDGSGGFAFWNSWCHGAPGIGLARLGSMNSLDQAIAKKDLENAIASASRPELNDSDGPCCGNFGRIEILIEASQKLRRPEALQRAREIGMLILERSAQNGDFAIGVKDGAFVPSFFQGMAGVGYQLLRLARPRDVPSVLRWE